MVGFPKLPPDGFLACSGFVTRVLNRSGELEAKTRDAALTADLTTLHVYRDSGKVPGWLSLDCYTRHATGWKGPWKDPAKYASAPQLPPGAITTVVDGVEYSRLRPITALESDCLRQLTLPQMADESCARDGGAKWRQGCGRLW